MNDEFVIDQELIALMRTGEAPASKDELDAYLRYYFDIYLAAVPIEEHNSSPLDFAWDIYSSALGLKPDPKLEDFNFLGVANRGGQKSLTCASIELLMLIFDEYRDYFHMAAIFQQSRVTYGYVQSVLLKETMNGVIKSTSARETIAHTGRSLKVGTGTIRNVNGFHGSVVQDEVDLTDVRVFNESKGMLSPGFGQRSPLDIKISSRKFAFGNIQTLLNHKERDPNYPLKVHKWGQLELTERCPPERSQSEEKTEILYVDEDQLLVMTPAEHALADPKRREIYVKKAAYPGCHACGIFSFCQTRLKKQAEDNPYLTKIDDVKRLFLTDDTVFFKSQRLNRKPSTLGLVYSTWSAEKHMRDFESMWLIWSGEEWNEETELDMDTFVTRLTGEGCLLYMGLDFGFNVAVALLMIKDGSDRIFVIDELVVELQSDADFSLAAWHQWGKFASLLVRGFGDVASPGAIKEFAGYFNMLMAVVAGKKNLTYKHYAKLSKTYNYRFGLVRKMLAAPGTGIARLYVHPQCQELITTVGLYRLAIDSKTGLPTEVPADGQRDHAVDALGHGIVGIFVAGGNATVAVVDTSEDTETLDGKLLGAPTPEQLGIMTGQAIGMGDVKVKPQSVPIDPETGEPIEEEKSNELIPKPSTGFRFIFTE